MQIGSAMCEIIGNYLLKSAVLSYQSLAPLGFAQHKVTQRVLEDHNYPFYIEMSFTFNKSLAKQAQKVNFLA